MSLYGRPTAEELAAAVEDFLRREAVPALDGRLGFQALVAANAVAVIRRELAAGAGPEAAHRERLATFGAANDSELVAAIRSGSLDDRTLELITALRTSIEAKLAVANPKYLHPPTS